MMDEDKVVSKVAHSLGYTLKPEQKRSLLEFIAGKDVFISLPTGFGKSLCYILLPPIFDLLRGVERKCIVLVVSPLIALMKDQVSAITAIGLSAAFISDQASTIPAVSLEIKNGDYQIVFISPEALFLTTRWRNMLCSNVYRSHLVGSI